MCDAMRRYVMAVMLCLVGATAVQAQGLPGVPTGTVLTEVMMDAQGTEAQLYGAMLGVSPSTPQTLSGTTSTDLSGGSFSFRLDLGSTYLGQSISDSVQGQFNPTNGSYDWTGMGSALGVTWTETGSITPFLTNSSGPIWGLNSTGSVRTLLYNPLFDENDQVNINGTSPTYSLCSLSLLDPLGDNVGTSIGRDGFNPLSGLYSFQDLFQPTMTSVGLNAFSDFTSGMSPAVGGTGTYTTTISSIPEPSSWVMGLLGALGLLGYVWWSRKAAGARVPTVEGA